VTDSLFSSSQP